MAAIEHGSWQSTSGIGGTHLAVLKWGYVLGTFLPRIGFSVAMSRIGGAAANFLLPMVMADYGIQVTLGICVAVLVPGGAICLLLAPEPSERVFCPIRHRHRHRRRI